MRSSSSIIFLGLLNSLVDARDIRIVRSEHALANSAYSPEGTPASDSSVNWDGKLRGNGHLERRWQQWIRRQDQSSISSGTGTDAAETATQGTSTAQSTENEATTTAEVGSTTAEASTSVTEESTTAESTISSAVSSTESSTASSTDASSTTDSSSTSTDAGASCYSTTTQTTTICATTGDSTASCTTTEITSSTCSPGLLCATQTSSGTTICMEKQDSGTAGAVIACVFSGLIVACARGRELLRALWAGREEGICTSTGGDKYAVHPVDCSPSRVSLASDDVGSFQSIEDRRKKKCMHNLDQCQPQLLSKSWTSVGQFRDFKNRRLLELKKGVENYTNSNVNEATAKSWSCSPEEAKLIWTACCCSRDVNGKGDNQYTRGLVVREEMKPSTLGTKKGVCIWNDIAKGTLIVAVRGSKAWVDHIVNLAHTTDVNLLTAKELVGSHSGYSSCTKALIPDLQATFEKHVRDDEQIRHVLFTGESSGGAVASLLFFHFASQCSEIFGAAKLSLITFGCPPVTPQNLTTKAERLRRVGLVLSFVNEGDFVARASEPYIQSILELYRRHIDEGNVEAAGEWGEWCLPGPSFYRYQIGRIVLLRPSLVRKDASTPGSSGDGCLELEYSDFARLLFCDLDVHKGSQYMERVQALKDKYDRPTS
ncbi:hypothetical protein NM208_g1639 [Fusarium decemcellulare]|uniref:Uncharacterized protein n=2 Tax=Fusarium decemcellulare TaxID=57161 RepID=A0ACC1SUB5_9HYPO|nr:hypothetical protein NM208_g2083 [Fusarium decemcellulare]KAJ3547194.1 hypothetical protein NM208_g1639 [Fusarium decemcellulare]